ncbi:bifunctional methionine sulfoxide reductase B/A protein [Paraferrimonas sedimenticola]|uniref:Peptide methionine sulfoxide reductase MsrA n=1 Tax=Paraferrimonas sedimenticola TaxID=375674 RepID=A0AA37W2J6_9GAMM|nr:bifunctional methionine sulfoxide reductase B/A protein [Paraferrimonas sedimenticola]GLP97902.1 peptide methionine sulfoxide reductase MsrA [Paraferrimonas sedimenticola]
MSKRELTEFERWVIEEKGTERPFSGEYDNFYQVGVYHCRRCDAPLYRSEDKFDAGCGWPAFDDEIPGAIKRVTDADGRRVEILCDACDAHLGHVFEGERLTEKNTRHCVNSVSMVFKAHQIPQDASLAKAVVGGGCFWCIEATLKLAKGVHQVVSGYAGGAVENPEYKAVCSGTTGHAEVVEVTYDPSQLSYADLLRLFFASHDPTTKDRQGNDVGTQYRSIVMVENEQQATTVNQVIEEVQQIYDAPIVTEVVAQQTFYPAEDEHQDYYQKHPYQGYCQAIISPKLAKFREQMAPLLKKE